MRRHLALIATALLVLPAQADAAEFTKKALTFEVTIGAQEDVSCTVAADLYTPAGATKQSPAPAMMGTNGFGGSKDDFASIGPAFARRGYVFLAYSGLGFGGSGCKITLDDPDTDGKAGSQLVSFLGGSKAATDGTRIDNVIRDERAHDGTRRTDDPRVGMIGGSYGGQIQFAIAGVDPRMDAIVPQITWNDLAYSLVPNNTDFAKGVSYATPGIAKIDWPVLFFGVGVGQGLAAALQDQTHVGVCPNFADDVCPALLSSVATGHLSESATALLRHASVATYVERIRIPTLLIQGQSDNLFNLQEAAATYRALHAQGTPVKMLWRSSGHSGGGLGKSEFDSDEFEKAYESRMALEFVDYYLRGLGTAPRLDFSFITDWLPYKGDAAPSVGSTPSYPAGTEEQLFLSGANGLVRSKAEVQPGAAAMAAVPLVPTSQGGGFADTGTRDTAGTHASFSTPPLAEDVDIAGIPRVTLRLTAPTFTALNPAAYLTLFVKLYDVAPDGSVSLPRNQVSAARIADVSKPVTIELPGVVHRFAKGHSLRLEVATSALSYHGGYGGGPVTITTDASNPGVLTIPRLGAPTGAPGSGPNGSTPFGPSPQAVKPQPAGLGGLAKPASAAAAKLPSLPTRRCGRSRTLRFKLKRPAGDGLRSATVAVNGKRKKSVRGKALRRTVVVRGLSRRAIRVVVTSKTGKGAVLRSARSYGACR